MPPTRAQVYRRRRLAVFGGAGALLLSIAYLPMTLFAPLEPTAAVAIETEAPTAVPADLAWPNSAAIGVGAVGFPGVLASTGSAEALPMASISKVVTVLTVLEEHPLTLEDRGPTVELTAKDVAYYAQLEAVGAAVKPVWSGLTLSQYELLQLVLVPSAANYTHSLVDWAFGNEEAFVAAANEWLDAHGLTETSFVEPTGLSPQNRSTVAELIELGKFALADPVVSEIVATTVVAIPGIGVIENSNEILGSYGIDGIKTGTLPEAGACLLFSSDLTVGAHSVTIVGVALGGAHHDVQNPQIQALVQTVQAGFQELDLVESGDVFGEYTTAWGDTAEAVATEDLSVLVWGDTPTSLAVQMDAIGAAPSGTTVGAASFTVGQELLEVPLVLSDALNDPGPMWRLTNPALLFG
ncbi:D-alanyl-D-alanine carboxypeptidase [Salinibacterium sp. SYSU T00001]|uniref:D-alanyl-D-alanine carboxypeptidase family protein n=1 Tax=Homoserinimonas sedimenticola TaxID=2986805 RepID=UPI0022357809|nr:D-alanyl-D-alanine carboxypeptidase [Salinibacterium sedimenticola]MCW4384432.1 D-alanyl-D-alanine carboxypeptidase [Salinibacterium sedimenticola]